MEKNSKSKVSNSKQLPHTRIILPLIKAAATRWAPSQMRPWRLFVAPGHDCIFGFLFQRSSPLFVMRCRDGEAFRSCRYWKNWGYSLAHTHWQTKTLTRLARKPDSILVLLSFTYMTEDVGPCCTLNFSTCYLIIYEGWLISKVSNCIK